MLAGERTISTVASEFGLSIAGLRRHMTRHVRTNAAEVSGLAPVEIASRMLDLAGRLEEAFEDAEERRSAADIARVGTVLDRVYRGLLDRGVRVELVERNAELEFDLKILTTAMRAYPELAATVAEKYEAADYLSAAERVRSLFPETKKELHQ